MSDPGGSVVVVHPFKQHAYQVAVALQQTGQLRQFVTGIYYKPAAFPYSLVARLPRPARDRALRELTKRVHPDLELSRVHSWPYAEVLSRTVGRMPWIVRLSRGTSGPPLAGRITDWHAARVIRRLRPPPQAVYGFHESAIRTFAYARVHGISTVLDVPIVLDAYDTIEQEYRQLGLREPLIQRPLRTMRAELALADWAIVPSPAVADSVRRAGFAGQGVFVLPFGVDTSVFRPRPTAPRPPRFRVVFAGRLDARKGLHYLLEAWRLAHLEGELILAGAPGGARFMRRMREQYRGLFIEVGNLVHSELADLLSTADVFVLPSLAEGSAYVTYEALASGLPCIVTAETGSVVRDGVEGFIVPARDVQALRGRLERLYNDSDTRRRMAQAALARGTEFTWRRYHQELAGVIAQVLEQRRMGQLMAQGR